MEKSEEQGWCEEMGLQYRGDGGLGQGKIPMAITSELEKFATSRNPEACVYFLVGSGWFLIFSMHSSHTTAACCKKTRLWPFPLPGTVLLLSKLTVLT